MRSSRSAGCATPGPSSWPRANRQSRASSRGFSSAGRRPSGTCTSSRWIRRRAGWARDEGLSRNRFGSSGLAGPTGCSPRCRETTIRRCACSSPSGSSGSIAGSCGGGIAGAGSPCRCGCSWLPMRSSSCALSPTSLPRRLKRFPRPRDAGSALTHGWIIHAYADYDRDSIVLWLWNERGAHRIEDPRVVPTFFLHASPSELPAIRRRIEILDGVRDVREGQKRIALEDDEPKPVLEIVPRHYRDIRNLAHILDSNGGDLDPPPVHLDLRFSQRYAIEHDIFPMGLLHYANGVGRGGEGDISPDYSLSGFGGNPPPLPAAKPAG